MMRNLSVGRWLSVVVIALGSGCSSDAASQGLAGDAGAHAGGGATSSRSGGAPGSGGGATSSQSGGAPGSAGAHTGGAGASGNGGAPASLDGSAPPASAACVKYCDCMAASCPDRAFAGGCLSACASQSGWDLKCRQVMCELAPLQPSNDHCTHAFGVGQCLDM